MAEQGLSTRTDLELELQRKLRQNQKDLAEAGAPAALTLETIGGGITGWGATRAVYKLLDLALKPKPGVAPGVLKRNPELTKGCVAGAVGLTTALVNLAVPYKYPMPYARGMALMGSTSMLTSGLDRIVDNFPKAAATTTTQPAPVQ